MEIGRLLYRLWRLEKEVEDPQYIVGLGSGVLRDGESTPAGRNVLDKCISLYHLRTTSRGIVLIGGRPWKSPPISDVTMMHRRLLRLGRSAEQLRIAPANVTILYGDNTYEQISALSKFLAGHPDARVIVVCPSMQSRRLRAILKKQGILNRSGITTVDDACEPNEPVEKFRWSQSRYFLREILAFIHHKLRRWV